VNELESFGGIAKKGVCDYSYLIELERLEEDGRRVCL
jgi:hypothetical protein